jgi:hypothetical protein
LGGAAKAFWGTVPHRAYRLFAADPLGADVKEYERKRLLERIDREASTVGADVPDEIRLDGEPFPLREFVFEVRSLDGVPPERRERVEWAKKQLRRARLERRQRIEEDDISKEEGERLVEDVVGIDRALNALSDLGPTDVEAAAASQERADQKRWFQFLRKALGHERDTSARGRGN